MKQRVTQAEDTFNHEFLVNLLQGPLTLNGVFTVSEGDEFIEATFQTAPLGGTFVTRSLLLNILGQEAVESFEAEAAWALVTSLEANEEAA